MEALRVLKLLNNKASKELEGKMLEEAADTANQAVNYYLATFTVANETQAKQGKLLLQCQAQLSALLLRKIGLQYRALGEQREDSSLSETGRSLIGRSSHILKLCRTMDTDDTARAPASPKSPLKRGPLHGKPQAVKLKPPPPSPKAMRCPSPCHVPLLSDANPLAKEPSESAASPQS